MALLRYFQQPADPLLPKPDGPLSTVVPSSSITAANKEVKRVLDPSDGAGGKDPTDHGCCLPLAGKAVFGQQELSKPPRRHGSLEQWSPLCSSVTRSSCSHQPTHYSRCGQLPHPQMVVSHNSRKFYSRKSDCSAIRESFHPRKIPAIR